MDVLLGQVTSQAMNYAIRSGITITTTYAVKECARLLKETPRSQAREELLQLQLRLESKIRIISPAIDMIELISARGNTSLESAMSLTKEIRYEIQRLGTRLSGAANDEHLLKTKPAGAKSRAETEKQLQRIVSDIKNLLVKIEDAVPLINLAITTSGVNLSTKLSGTISPSRLLQASTFLTAADSKYATQADKRVQVGPTYTVSLYMLFAGHALRPVDEAGVREMTWKEVMHKAKLKLVRLSLQDLYNLPGAQTETVGGGIAADSIPGEAKMAEFAYQLVLVEDLDDDRVHTFDDGELQPGSFEDVANAGIRDIVSVHEVSKVFYADTGKILNIGGGDDGNNPVLLLKRDVHAEPPRRMMHRSQMSENGYYDDSVLEKTELTGGQKDQFELDAQLHGDSAPSTPLKDTSAQDGDKYASWRLPADLDPEWMAFEVYIEEPDSDDDLDDTPPEQSEPATTREGSPATHLANALSKLNFRSSTPKGSPMQNRQPQLLLPSKPSHHQATSPSARSAPQIKTSLSLLEMLLKLTALQQFRQESHLAIEDELLNFFLEDSASAGAGPDKDYRQRLRHEAVKRVGFDPYDESPIKRRGEVYLEHARGAASPRPTFNAEAFAANQRVGGNGYDLDIREPTSSPRLSVRQSIEEDDALLSSPSPMPHPAQRNSGEASHGVFKSTPPSNKHDTPRATSLLATPPSTARSRQTFPRSQSEQKTRSPLHRSESMQQSTRTLDIS